LKKSIKKLKINVFSSKKVNKKLKTIYLFTDLHRAEIMGCMGDPPLIL